MMSQTIEQKASGVPNRHIPTGASVQKTVESPTLTSQKSAAESHFKPAPPRVMASSPALAPPAVAASPLVEDPPLVASSSAMTHSQQPQQQNLKDPPQSNLPSQHHQQQQPQKPPPDAQQQRDAAAAAAQSIRPTAGIKRTLMTHTKDGKLLSEKKLRRLEKNRLSARECRRRKREATENLQREINVLEAENLKLRLQMQIGKEAEDTRLKEQEELTKDFDALLKSGASEADIHATLEEFKEKHADYGKSRRSALEFHLRNIERLLMPTQTTSLVMHAIQGGDHADTAATTPTSTTPAATAAASSLLDQITSSSSTDSATSPLPSPLDPSQNPNLDPKALFQYLVKHLEVSPQQAAALKDSRFVSKELDGCLEKALGVLEELRQRLNETGDDLEAQFNDVRSILTPTQAAKFLVWVANNRACVHMLNELWDRVHGSSDVVATTAAEDTDESP